jgi:hypothetical protein
MEILSKIHEQRLRAKRAKILRKVSALFRALHVGDIQEQEAMVQLGQHFRRWRDLPIGIQQGRTPIVALANEGHEPNELEG